MRWYWEALSMLGRLTRLWLLLFPGCGLFVMSLSPSRISLLFWPSVGPLAARPIMRRRIFAGPLRLIWSMSLMWLNIRRKYPRVTVAAVTRNVALEVHRGGG